MIVPAICCPEWEAPLDLDIMPQGMRVWAVEEGVWIVGPTFLGFLEVVVDFVAYKNLCEMTGFGGGECCRHGGAPGGMIVVGWSRPWGEI